MFLLQVGFTTDPVDDRSTMYASDLGKGKGLFWWSKCVLERLSGFALPVLHVNGDDPVAVTSAFQLAAEWRQTWATDASSQVHHFVATIVMETFFMPSCFEVIVDVICYRRFGHNETELWMQHSLSREAVESNRLLFFELTQRALIICGWGLPCFGLVYVATSFLFTSWSRVSRIVCRSPFRMRRSTRSPCCTSTLPSIRVHTVSLNRVLVESGAAACFASRKLSPL